MMAMLLDPALGQGLGRKDNHDLCADNNGCAAKPPRHELKDVPACARR
jgi:hypothetical protein